MLEFIPDERVVCMRQIFVHSSWVENWLPVFHNFRRSLFNKGEAKRIKVTSSIEKLVAMK